jgi:tetratricopeptide (TPR) repeat protein
VKIIDFGIAKAASQSTKTQIGIVKGKAAYMSPEQAEGKDLDHRSDIFAVGIVLYEFATHKRVFEGETFEVLFRVVNADFEPPEKVRPDLPEEVCRIINRALAKEPEKRYPSCADMMADIENCIQTISSRYNAKNMAQYMLSLFDTDYVAEKKESSEAMKLAVPENPSYAATEIIDRNREETSGSERDNSKTATKLVSVLPEQGIFIGKLRTLFAAPKWIWPLTAGLVLFLSVGIPRSFKKDQSGVQPVVQHQEQKWPIDKPEEITASKAGLSVKNDETDGLRADLNTKRDDLLRKARICLETSKLITPPDDSANYYYNEALRLDPENQEAREGFNEIATRYASLAERDMKRYQYDKAREYISRGLSVSPQHQRLLELQERCNRIAARSDSDRSMQESDSTRSVEQSDPIRDVPQRAQRVFKNIRNIFN